MCLDRPSVPQCVNTKDIKPKCHLPNGDVDLQLAEEVRVRVRVRVKG